MPQTLVNQIKQGKVNLDDPATTLAVIKVDAVLGVKGTFNPNGSLKAVGLTCAVCRSTVDDAFAPRIGRRLDGWSNQDLNVVAIVSLAPDLSALTIRLKPQRDNAAFRSRQISWPSSIVMYLRFCNFAEQLDCPIRVSELREQLLTILQAADRVRH